MITILRVRGWVISSSVIEAVKSWCDEQPKYRLQIQPEYPIFEEIENRIERLQDEHKKETEFFGNDEYKKQPTYKERVIDGCLICTESLHPPKRFDLDEVQLDDQLIGTFVNTVGHLKIHESSGDVYLSSHIVERASNPCDLFDPVVVKIRHN